MTIGQLISLESHAALMGLRVRREHGVIVFSDRSGRIVASALGEHEARIVLVGR